MVHLWDVGEMVLESPRRGKLDAVLPPSDAEAPWFLTDTDVITEPQHPEICVVRTLDQTTDARKARCSSLGARPTERKVVR